MKEPEPIEDESVELIRQVQPLHFSSKGVVKYSAFVPGPRHDGQLSTMHGRIGAQKAYDDWRAQDYESAGSWIVTVGEARNNGVCDGIEALLDEGLNDMPVGHVSIDFRPTGDKPTTIRLAKALARAANDRGRAHP